MPAWNIHLALAHKLKPNNDDFALGNILPDVLDGYLITPSHITDKNQSHFRLNKQISPKLFIKTFKSKLDNPLILGYLTHLLTDNFYNEYTAKNHFITENNKTIILLSNKKTINKDTNTLIMKQQELNKYGQKLADKKLLGNPIQITNNTFKYLKILPFNYTNEDIHKTIKAINNIIQNKEPKSTCNYQLFTEKELDELYDKCYEYLKNYLNKIRG